MVVEPVNPADRATQQFAWLIDAAFRSAAAVIFVPPHVMRITGPVVAIAAAPDDPSIRTAAAIAVAAKEELVVMEAYRSLAEDPGIRKLATDTGLRIKHVAIGDLPLSDPAPLSQAFRRLQERLVIMTRGVLANEIAVSIASARRVPWLVIEPSTGDTGGEG
jgi:hypothetical protein